jgi:polyisoprenoid-binding protein YceI
MENVMKTIYAMVITLLIFAFTTQNAFAAAREWELDQAHSNIYFSIDHIYSKIRGRFSEVTGKVNFDPANLKESRFDFELKVDSIDTGIGKRDKHLLSADFFDSGKYPLITFESKKITDAGNGVYEVAGKLTVKGKVHDLILPLTFAGIKDHPAVPGKQVAGFNGNVTVDRLPLQVGDGKFYKMGIVGKDVEVLVSLEALGAKTK